MKRWAKIGGVLLLMGAAGLGACKKGTEPGNLSDGSGRGYTKVPAPAGYASPEALVAVPRLTSRGALALWIERDYSQGAKEGIYFLDNWEISEWRPIQEFQTPVDFYYVTTYGEHPLCMMEDGTVFLLGVDRIFRGSAGGSGMQLIHEASGGPLYAWRFGKTCGANGSIGIIGRDMDIQNQVGNLYVEWSADRGNSWHRRLLLGGFPLDDSAFASVSYHPSTQTFWVAVTRSVRVPHQSILLEVDTTGAIVDTIWRSDTLLFGPLFAIEASPPCVFALMYRRDPGEVHGVKITKDSPPRFRELFSIALASGEVFPTDMVYARDISRLYLYPSVYPPRVPWDDSTLARQPLRIMEVDPWNETWQWVEFPPFGRELLPPNDPVLYFGLTISVNPQGDRWVLALTGVDPQTSRKRSSTLLFTGKPNAVGGG